MATKSNDENEDINNTYQRLTSDASRAAADALFKATGEELGLAFKQNKMPGNDKDQVDLEDVLYQNEVEIRLGVTEATLSKMEKGYEVISYETQGTRVYPAWQFGGNALLPGLANVTSALRTSGVEALRMFTVPLELANGKSLYQLVIEGEIAQAVRIARELRVSVTHDSEDH